MHLVQFQIEIVSTSYSRDEKVYSCCPDEIYPSMTMSVTFKILKQFQDKHLQFPWNKLQMNWLLFSWQCQNFNFIISFLQSSRQIVNSFKALKALESFLRLLVLEILNWIFMRLFSLMAVQRNVALKITIDSQMDMLFISNMNFDKVIRSSNNLKN